MLMDSNSEGFPEGGVNNGEDGASQSSARLGLAGWDQEIGVGRQLGRLKRNLKSRIQ